MRRLLVAAVSSARRPHRFSRFAVRPAKAAGAASGSRTLGIERLETRALLEATPTGIAAALDLPSGVTVTYTGDPLAVQTRTAPRMDLFGIPSGADSDFLILSSGVANDVDTKSYDPGESNELGTDLGPAGNPGDTATVSFSLPVPVSAVKQALKFDFVFLSEEYPEYVGREFNDSFSANVNGTEIAYDPSGNRTEVNDADFLAIPSSAGMFFAGHGRTATATAVYAVSAGTTQLNVSLAVEDASNGFFDSAVLLDNFRFEPDPGGTTLSERIAEGLDLPDGVTVAYAGDPAAIEVRTMAPPGGLLGFPSGVDNDFVMLSTGVADEIDTLPDDPERGTDLGADGPEGDTATVSFSISVLPNPATRTLKFDFIFLSEEYPPTGETTYNDFFSATVNGTEIAYDQSGNRTDADHADFLSIPSNAGMFFAGHGRTEKVAASYQVPAGMAKVEVTLTVGDAGDGNYDTAVILDNFRFEPGLEDPATELGPIDYLIKPHQIASALGRWYRLRTTHPGILASELIFQPVGGTGLLELYRNPQDSAPLAASSLVDGVQRIDWQVNASDVYYLRLSGTNPDVAVRLSNLVSQTGTSVTVYGTAGADVLELLASSASLAIKINHVGYVFPSAMVTTVDFDGGQGANRAVLQGTTGDDRAVLNAHFATLWCPGLTVNVSRTSSIALDLLSGENDVVQLYDSDRDDTLIARARSIALSRKGDYTNSATGFDSAYVYATAGGNDRATMEDGPGNDTFSGSYIETSGLVQAEMAYETGQTIAVHGFETVEGQATHGGTNSAILSDGPGNDTFAGFKASSTLQYAEGTRIIALRFPNVYAYADFCSSDRNDRAILYHSAFTDRYTATPTIAKIAYDRGAAGQNWTQGFDAVHAYATPGGSDTAEYYDSSGNDSFTSDAATLRSSMTGEAGFIRSGDRFRTVYAHSTGGLDMATLNGTPGNDVLTLTPAASTMTYGGGGLVFVHAFYQVTANGGPRGNDIAYLYDSPGDDVLRLSKAAQSIETTGKGGRVYGTTTGFDRVYAKASTVDGGRDKAYFEDEAGLSNLFFGSAARSYMYYARQRQRNEADAFEEIDVIFSGGGDRVLLEGSKAMRESLSNTASDDLLLKDTGAATCYRIWLHGLDDHASVPGAKMQRNANGTDQDMSSVAAVDYLFRLAWEQL